MLAIILLLFGAKRISELAKGLGNGVREFKKGTERGDEVDKEGKAENGHSEDADTRNERVVLTAAVRKARLCVAHFASKFAATADARFCGNPTDALWVLLADVTIQLVGRATSRRPWSCRRPSPRTRRS